MSEKVQLKGCVCEVNFEYDARTEGYANIAGDGLRGSLKDDRDFEGNRRV